MKIGVLGSGMVGQALAGRLVELGHAVMVGTRDAAKLQDWLKTVGGKAQVGSFAATAAHGEMLVLALKGEVVLTALEQAGAANLAGKTLLDITNPLDFSKGMPPSLFISNTDSLGEHIQNAFPTAKVVKSLNTVTAQLMVYPQQLAGGAHTMFVCGNDATAKAQVTTLLQSFGWSDIVDLGDITNARGTEQLLPIWVRLWGTLQTPMFNLKVVR